MAEQKPAGEKAKGLKQSPSSSSSRRSTSPRTTPGGSTPPPPAPGANQAARLASQARQQEQNNAAFARLFATLEGEQRKLRELEARRMKLTEEMKGLRALLLKENQRLKTTVAPLLNPPAMPSTSGSSKPGVPKRRASPAALVPSPGPAVAPKPASGGVVAEPPAPPTPGVPHPTPSPAPNRTPTPNVPKPTPSPVVADPAEGEDPPATPTAILTSNVPAIPSILKKTSSTGPAAVEPGQAKTVAINIRPRASSTGSMQRRAKGVGARGRMLRKKNHKGKNRSSPRTIESKREDVTPLDEDSPAISSTLQTLENRRPYTNAEAPREDLDEVLVSLPTLFTFIDAQLEQEPPLFATDSEEVNQDSAEIVEQELVLRDDYQPDAKSLLGDLLGEKVAPPSTEPENLALDLVDLAGISIESPESQEISIESPESVEESAAIEISIEVPELVELSHETPASAVIPIQLSFERPTLSIEAPPAAELSMAVTESSEDSEEKEEDPKKDEDL
ncbi:uncharacterized protein Dana_GF19508 [Drosophila ananassae]|uniref:Uncharacterized protein n=1 Tax=Drosophila ananassae TaxID=7217 RepID=B3MXR5_DROAN|nr:nascent polypeptide-associated complex subunit alpha, muscle-specific form [Drosophila ananassae]EDV38530.1 uncharacterized protein Dana_GF19508 [Drosophila ananassae]